MGLMQASGKSRGKHRESQQASQPPPPAAACSHCALSDTVTLSRFLEPGARDSPEKIRRCCAPGTSLAVEQEGERARHLEEDDFIGEAPVVGARRAAHPELLGWVLPRRAAVHSERCHGRRGCCARCHGAHQPRRAPPERLNLGNGSKCSWTREGAAISEILTASRADAELVATTFQSGCVSSFAVKR